MKKILFAYLFIVCFSAFVSAQIPVKTLVQISRAEDELRYDAVLENLLKNKDAKIRERAALAAGRIGDEAAIPALVDLLENDADRKVREMAAFALGETESVKAADAILKILDGKDSPSLRARATEAAGKIAAANVKDEKSKKLGEAILATVDFEDRKRSGPHLDIIELGLTAILRARPANAERVLVKFIDAYTPQIRANALNALARLRSKNAGKQARELLEKDADATVRANAARVLSAAEDKDAFELLLKAAMSDEDSRVRVSAIRALGNLKDKQAADKLLERGEILIADYKKSKFPNPSEKSEILEIATALGTLLEKTKNEKALNFLDRLIRLDRLRSAEIPFARIKISQVKFDSSLYKDIEINPESDLNIGKTLFQLFGEVANFDDENPFKKEMQQFAGNALKYIYEQKNPENNIIPALPDLISSYAKFKPDDLNSVLLDYINHEDVFIRAAVAELLSEQTATKENIEALKKAFAKSLQTDKNYNDAQLAILSALVKLDKAQSFESLRLALTATDYLVRKHAANLIKQNDLTKDFSNVEKMVGTLEPYNNPNSTSKRRIARTRLGRILNTEADYVRAVSRRNGTVKAVFTTEKGNFTIDLTPEDAPLTVDNFIKLAKSEYFNGVLVHRVVPNFVMQDGDPRGDGNGGPGWQIRCEINMLEFDRSAVGMALSGKDTGGSQWFVTHSSQPHLDGGYTVFGRVNETDMKVVDSIVRGDKILSVEIVEGKSPARKR